MPQHPLLAQAAQGLLLRLAGISRQSRHEGPAADMLQQYMEQSLGLEVCRHGHNLWAIAPGHDDSRPTLLLNAHTDTVAPAPGWTRPPLAPTLEDGRIYGLGTNDDGASLVCLLHVFAHLAARPRSHNLVFLASAEEEVSGAGGVQSVIPLLPRIDVALVGEPTGMQPAVAEKGLMVVDFEAPGRAGHAARDEGDNAIYHALDDIQWLRSHEWQRVSPLLGPVKCTVTIISAGTQHNVVPATCAFTADIRSNELYSNEEIFAHIRSHVCSQARARSFRLGSSSIPAGHPLVRRALALGRQPFGSPTLSDQALMPWPSLKMGPGDSRRSHAADEYVTTAELEQAIDLYISLLEGLDLQ